MFVYFLDWKDSNEPKEKTDNGICMKIDGGWKQTREGKDVLGLQYMSTFLHLYKHTSTLLLIVCLLFFYIFVCFRLER